MIALPQTRTDGAALSCQPVPAGTAAMSAGSGAKLLSVAVASRALVLQGGSEAIVLHREASGSYTAGTTFPGGHAGLLVYSMAP